MPNERLDDDLEVEDEDEETEETEETEESTDESDDEAPKLDPKTQKRLSDLQSKADAADARASKAEKALNALNKGGEGSKDPVTQALMQELREASLDAVWGEFPELKKYGIDRSLVEGSTRAEMRESATSIVGLVKTVATKVRNQTLADNGLSAEPSSSNRTPPKDYSTMSDEDFEKVLASIS